LVNNLNWHIDTTVANHLNRHPIIVSSCLHGVIHLNELASSSHYLINRLHRFDNNTILLPSLKYHQSGVLGVDSSLSILFRILLISSSIGYGSSSSGSLDYTTTSLPPTMLIRIISNDQSFALGIVEPFIKLLHEDNNNDDEGKCNDVLSRLSFSSYPSWTRHESNSPLTNHLGVIAKSSFSFIRPLVLRVICGCIKALPVPVKSFVVTSIDQLNPLVDSVASLDTLDGIVKDDNLLRLTLPAESKVIVATTSELLVASSSELLVASSTDLTTLVGIDKEESYFPNALNFVVIGCMIILLALGCGIIRLGTAILCLGIFQAVILEYNYQMISSFINVLMKCLVMIFTSSSSNVDLDDASKVAEGEELAAPTLGSSSLCLDMPSSTASNEMVIPIDVSTVVDGSNSSDVSIEPYKSCLVALLLLIFTSLIEIVDVLSVVPYLISFLPMVLTSLVDIVDTLSVIDWLILLILVGSIIIISTASSKQPALGSDVETGITTSASSALDDTGDASLASFEMDKSSTDESQSEMASNWKQVVQHPSAVPFNLMGTLRSCLSSRLQHVRHKRHNLLVAFLLMASAPLLVMVAVLMVLFDFWTILQALVVGTCLIYAATYTTKALQSIPTHLRGSTSALVNRTRRLNLITTIGNIVTDESCLLTLMLMVIVPLMGIVVILMMLILVSFNWSLVVQVLAEWTMIIPSCLISVRQACGVVMLMMCLKTITYYLLRLWQYQLSIVFTFLDVIGASGPLVNRMRRMFAVISFALAYYDDDRGAIRTTRGGMLTSATVRTSTPPIGLVDTARGILYSATTSTLNSIWTILAWVAKKLVYLIVYISILLVYVFMMLVRSIDYKAAVYTSMAYLIQLPTNIIWGIIGRLAVALLGCIIYLYTNIKLLVLAPFNQVEQKERLPPPPAIAVSDDEDSDDDDSTIDFGAADPIDCVDVPLFPPPPPKRRTRRPRKVYPPAVWHRGRAGRGGRLRPRPPKPG